MVKTVMIYGLGEVSAAASELLGRTEGVDRIVTADIDEELGAFRTNLAAISCVYQGFLKKFEFRRSDVSDIDATAKLLEEVKPDAILLGLTIQRPRVLRLVPLPQDIREKVDMAGFGFWLPWHLVLPAKFMQAVEKSGIQTHVVNASFPDVVGPVIWKRFGFGPTVGLGNMDRVAASIARHVGIAEGVQLQDVTLYFVACHAISQCGSKTGVPFFLKILLGDRDVTSKYDVNWLTDYQGGCSPSSKVYQQFITNTVTGASGARNIMAIIGDTNEFTHSPSPNGLIGGYPLRLSAKGAEVVLPKELTLEQAIRINEEGERFDGIEKVKDDGTVVYTDQSYSIMRELGYDCKELPFDEAESRSEELKVVYKKLAAR